MQDHVVQPHDKKSNHDKISKCCRPWMQIAGPLPLARIGTPSRPSTSCTPVLKLDLLTLEPLKHQILLFSCTYASDLIIQLVKISEVDSLVGKSFEANLSGLNRSRRKQFEILYRML